MIYFEDPTSILCKYWLPNTFTQENETPPTLFTFPVADIDPMPTERFPEYVRDMLYGEEHKLKAEFSVRSPYMVFLPRD